jgi:hypothetical protein
MRAGELDAARVAAALSAYQGAQAEYQKVASERDDAARLRASWLARLGVRRQLPEVEPLEEQAQRLARALLPLREEIASFERLLGRALLVPSQEGPAPLSRLGARLLARLSSRPGLGLGSVADWLPELEDAPSRIDDFSELVMRRMAWMMPRFSAATHASLPFAALALGHETPEEEARFLALHKATLPRSIFDTRRGLAASMTAAWLLSQGFTHSEWEERYREASAARIPAGMGQAKMGLVLLSMMRPGLVERVVALCGEAREVMGRASPQDVPMLASLCYATQDNAEACARLRASKGIAEHQHRLYGSWVYSERFALAVLLAHATDPEAQGLLLQRLRDRISLGRKQPAALALGLLSLAPGDADGLLDGLARANAVLARCRWLSWSGRHTVDGAAAVLVVSALYTGDPSPGGKLALALGYFYVELLSLVMASS